MAIILDNIVTNVRSLTNSFIPSKINVNETFNSNFDNVPYGRNRNWQRPANATIKLEFTYYDDTNIVALRNVLMNRKYDKKVYVDEPSTEQLYDMYAGTTYCYHGTSDTFPSSWTELTSGAGGEYSKIVDIDSNAYFYSQSTNKYSWLKFEFDISTFNTLYPNSIERLTLMLHNPYAASNGAVAQDGYKIFINDASTNGPGYVCIGEQSFSISDTVLRTAGQMNQQFYSYKKTQDIITVSSTSNIITFYMRNLTPRTTSSARVGLNYVALIINGYGVKQSNADNFTYQEPTTVAGSIGTVELQEA